MKPLPRLCVLHETIITWVVVLHLARQVLTASARFVYTMLCRSVAVCIVLDALGVVFVCVIRFAL